MTPNPLSVGPQERERTLNARTAIFLTALFLAAGWARAEAAPPATTTSVAPNTVFVKLRNAPERDSGRQAVDNFLRGNGGGSLAPCCPAGAVDRLRRLAANRGRGGRAQSSLAGIERLFVCIYADAEPPAEFARRLMRLPEVEYAEPRYLRRTSVTPNDQLYGQPGQDFFAYHAFPAAWDVTHGSASVVIAIVDSGVDYNHPDLAAKLWHNTAEVNGFPGEDDDQNGFTDDTKGWDFWQSGTFPDQVVSDNDPLGDYSNHGTHVAGIAAAHTNNNLGVAGTGFDCIYMAVKAGGTQADPGTIGFGAEGILYAAANGAQIINCSWGSADYSRAEQDAVDTATQTGALVVCAAGNESTETPHYPSAYANALAVGALSSNSSVKSSFTNYGYWVDVIAAGTGIKSTVFSGAYATKSGTSMATPVVSGLAGLLKAKALAAREDWPPERLAAQIRASSVLVDAQNPGFEHKLGRGRIDAAAALGTAMPGFRVVQTGLTNAQGKPAYLNEDATLAVQVSNVNAAADAAVFTLTALSDGVTVTTATVNHGAFPAGEQHSVAFPVHVGVDADPLLPLRFLLEYADAPAGYSDFAVIEISSLTAATCAVNSIRMTLTSTGALGFVDAFNAQGGIGFIPRAGDPTSVTILFEGALMLAADGVILDAARETTGLSQDFTPLSGFAITEPGTVSDADGFGQFRAPAKTGTPPLDVTLESFAFTDPTLAQCVFLKYTIHNPTAYTLDNLYVGLFNDWDIAHPQANTSGLDAANNVLYVFDASDASQPWAAVAPMTDPSSLFAIANGYSETIGPWDFSIYYTEGSPTKDGFTDAEKLTSLQAGTQRTVRTAADVSTVVASGPYSVPGGQDAVVGFVYAYGNGLSDLLYYISNARTRDLFAVTTPGTTAPANQAPSTQIVSPPGTTVYLPAANLKLAVTATATDDGRPAPGVLTALWECTSGPAVPDIDQPDQFATVIEFPLTGTYQVRVTVSDGFRTAQAAVTVVVATGAPLGANVAPTVSAGPDQNVPVGEFMPVDGSVADDGLPARRSGVTVTWSLVSGPAQIEITDAAAAHTTMRFPQDGAYVLRLTADDGDVRTADDVTITATDGLLVRFAAAATTVTEHVGTAQIDVILSGPRTQTITVPYRVTNGTASGNGVDYTRVDGTLEFPVDASSRSIPVPVVDDVEPETNETVVMELTAPDGVLLGQALHTLTLADNEREFTISVSGAQTAELRFGMWTGATAGTDAFDAATTRPADPQTPFLRFVPESGLAPSELRTDTRAPGPTVLRWRLLADLPSTGGTVNLSWDFTNANVPPDLRILLQQLDNESPAGAPVDMRSTQALPLDASAEFEIALGLEEDAGGIPLETGWNFIGIPVLTTQSIQDLLAGERTTVPCAWRLDNSSWHRMNPTEILNPERAYWVYSPSQTQSAAVRGLPADGLFSLNQGWNALSPIHALLASGPDLGHYVLWSWHSTARVFETLAPTESAQPFRCYWLYSPQPGSIRTASDQTP